MAIMSTAKAIKILAKCEGELRALVSTSASNGDYDAVLRITSWAKQISAFSSGGAIAAAERRPANTGQRKLANRADYPRFARRGDQLVKIGWSKREKREYEHKAPRQAAMLLAKTAADVGRDGRIFQVNALLPLLDGDGSEIPDYQIYVVVAWWRSAGLLDQHGRQGYSIPEASRLSQAVESAWGRLAED